MASIRKNPRSGRWEVRYRSPDGRQRTKGGFGSKADANAYRASIEHGLNRGDWRDPVLGRITVADWAMEYLRGAVHKRATTLHRDRGSLDRYVLPVIGGIPMAKVTPRDIRQVFDLIAPPRLAPATIGGVWGTVAHMFKTAVEADVIAQTPCRGIRLPRLVAGERIFLSVTGVDRLAGAIDPAYRAFVTLGGFAGPRFSELAGFRVRSVDFLQKKITVSQSLSEVSGTIAISDTKTSASRRTIPLPSHVIEDLSAMLAARPAVDPGDWLFQMPRGGPLRYSNFHRSIWTPAVRAAELEGFKIHGLRHTAAGFLIQAKAHPRVIQRRLGHAKFSTTMDLYGSLLPEVEEGAADDLEALIVRERGADVVQPRSGLSAV